MGDDADAGSDYASSMYVARRRKGKEGGDWDLQFTIYMTQDHVQWMLAASSSVMSAL